MLRAIVAKASAGRDVFEAVRNLVQQLAAALARLDFLLFFMIFYDFIGHGQCSAIQTYAFTRHPHENFDYFNHEKIRNCRTTCIPQNLGTRGALSERSER